jgi:hypothetical protein
MAQLTLNVDGRPRADRQCSVDATGVWLRRVRFTPARMKAALERA